MRILIATGIYPPDIGGPATYSKLLKDELPKQGIEVDVLSFGAKKFKYFPKGIKHIIYFIEALRLGASADIIFAQDPVSVGFPAMLAAKILNKKFVIKIVGDYAWEQGSQRYGVSDTLDVFLNKKYGLFVEMFRRLEKFVTSRAVKIIVPSSYLNSVIIKWGIAPEKAAVIYNAFEAPPGEAIELSKDEVKKQLGLEGKIIVSAGRLVPWKGFEALIEIIPELSKKFGDALDERAGLKLIIIGDGPERKRLEIVGNKAEIVGKVIFTGPLPGESVLDYLRSADVFALNTSYEGLSHQILEAMSLGVPVVTTDVGGNPELIIDGATGFLLPFNDKSAFAEKIDKILSDKDLAQKMGSAAKEKAGEFSKERMLGDTINLLKNL